MPAAALALALALLALAARVARARRRAPPLPAAEPDPPEVTVLLPVRDEEENVVACVESLLAQSVRPRVRVIDDGSGDRTAELVAGLIAGHRAGAERLELLAAGELPDGWGGKVHALARGAGKVDSPWILATDADTRHAPEALARALAAARRHRLDLVSLAGHQRVEGPGEGLVTPLVFALLDAALGDWRAHAEGRAAEPVANGQFLLMRREALATAGGFAAIRGASLDDVALARAFAGADQRVGFLRAPRLLEVRMYRGLVESWRGWRRNLALFFGPTPARLWTAVAWLALPALAALAAAAGREWTSLLVLWSGGIGASALLRATGGYPARHALLWPLDALALAALLAVARRDHRRRRLAPWKGRRIAPAQDGGNGAS